MDIEISASGNSPIYRQIVDQISGMASRGALKPGDRIPSVRELSVELEVNPNTVARAYRDLQQMKAIHSRRGEGNFISGKFPAPSRSAKRAAALKSSAADARSASKFAVLAVASEGHMYEAMHRHLVSRLQSKGIVPVSSHVDRDLDVIRRGLDDVMRLKPASIIIDGGVGEKIMGFLEERAESFGSVIFIMCKPLNISGKFKSHSVVTDYWLGGYHSTKHLIALGHKRIMLMMLKKDRPPEEFRLIPRAWYEDGYRAALKEAGLSDSEQFFYDDYDIEASKAAFSKFLKSKDLPTAIVSTEDFRITSKLECFRRAGMRIPEDISVVGYYNTPWSTATEVQLSSLSIREDMIAEKIAAIMSGEEKSNEILIAPELISRSSCRALKTRKLIHA